MLLFLPTKVTPLDLHSSHHEQSLLQKYELILKVHTELSKRCGKKLWIGQKETPCCIIMRHYEVKKLQGEKVSQTGREGVLLLP